MKIAPSLQSVMDQYIKIARATFAKDTDDQQLQDTVLFTFAGMGLAKQVRRSKDVIWARTDKLKELEKTPTAPIDLTPFMAATGDDGNEPEMTESLRLIIEDMMAACKESQPENSDNITVNSTLLILAGQGLASLGNSTDDSSIWVASPHLIDCFQMGKDGIASTPNCPSEIQMDEALDTVAGHFYEMSKRRFKGKLGRRSAVISTLWTLEITGDAIAYRDDQGRLAWKSSGSLKKSFE